MAYGGMLLSTSQEVSSHASHSWNMCGGLSLIFFLISNEMQYNVKLCKHLPSFLSDHSPVVLRVYSLVDSELRGRGYWKFNTSLTKTNDNKFVETLKNICEWKSTFDS